MQKYIKTMQDKHHGQCWQASCNFLDELLDETGWDDGAPTLATSTETPVCSRHLAILWSLEEGNKGWGDERRRAFQLLEYQMDRVGGQI